MLSHIQKEIARLLRRVFSGSGRNKFAKDLEYKLENLPYEIHDKIKHDQVQLEIPLIKSAEETLDKIKNDRCSLARFGDGEFSLIRGSRIHFQDPSSKLSTRLQEVIKSQRDDLLIGLPECFAALDSYLPDVAQFWRKWMAQKRKLTYSYLDFDRTYYSAFFTRAYMPYIKTEAHYQRCQKYFNRVKELWYGRDVIICEGEGTRFGMFNDLLDGAKSISRILCPARHAFANYEQIVNSFQGVDKKAIVLAALGPTATVLAHDLCKKGFQTIDIGHLDIEYEWFLQKAAVGGPLKHKYVDGTKKGRRVHRLKDSRYESQIFTKIL